MSHATLSIQTIQTCEWNLIGILLAARIETKYGENVTEERDRECDNARECGNQADLSTKYIVIVFYFANLTDFGDCVVFVALARVRVKSSDFSASLWSLTAHFNSFVRYAPIACVFPEAE